MERNERNLVVMHNGARYLRFDIWKDNVIITGAVGRTTKQAIAPLVVAQDFVSDLMDADWTRNQEIEAELQRDSRTTMQAPEAEGE
jgi:hypothetical protein